MKTWFALSLTLIVASSCTKTGSFCTIYDPVYFGPEAAREVAALDPDAAKTAAANNAYFEQHCQK